MQESKHVCNNHFTNFSMGSDGIGYTIKTCWPDEAETHFILYDQHSRERTLLM